MAGEKAFDESGSDEKKKGSSFGPRLGIWFLGSELGLVARHLVDAGAAAAAA